LLPHRFTLTAGVSGERRVAGGGLLSVPLSVGFRRLGFPQRPALRCPDFPRAGPAGPRSPGLRHGLYPAPFRAGPAAASRTPSSALPHSGQKIDRSGSRSTNSPQTRHSRLAPRKSACNSWSRERLRATTAPPMSEPPEDADDLAENVDVTGVDGLERGVLGLQPDGAVLPEEALDRRLLCELVVPNERGDDVAVLGVLLPADDHVVPVEDPCVDHRVAAYAQDELLAAVCERLGDADVALDRLLGEQRPAGGDLPEHREHVRLRGRPRRPAPLAPDELERARLRRVAPQEPCPLEVRQVRVDRRRRREPDRLTDLANGRRIPVAVDVLDQEVPDLPLPRGEHASSLSERAF